ncbi:unnamed protein product [Urochloa humidicola]
MREKKGRDEEQKVLHLHFNIHTTFNKLELHTCKNSHLQSGCKMLQIKKTNYIFYLTATYKLHIGALIGAALTKAGRSATRRPRRPKRRARPSTGPSPPALTFEHHAHPSTGSGPPALAGRSAERAPRRGRALPPSLAGRVAPQVARALPAAARPHAAGKQSCRREKEKIS